MIGNPEKQNSGDSFAQVCRKISEITGKTIKNHIFLIGIGMGNEQTLTMEATEKIREADYIFGAERLLRIIKNEQAVRYPYYLAADIVPELDRLSGCGVKVVILFSGDTGFYSGCGKLYETLKGRSDSSVRIYPGISSVSYFAALTGYSYQDAAVLSIHGHGVETEWIGNLTETIRFSKKTFLLMSGKEDVQKLGRLLQKYHLQNCKVLAGFQLSYPQEKVLALTPEACEHVEETGLYICLILNPDAEKRQLPVGCGMRNFCGIKFR